MSAQFASGKRDIGTSTFSGKNMPNYSFGRV